MNSPETASSSLSSQSVPLWRQPSVWLVVLPVLCFVVFVFTYAINVPWLDDIDSFLGFMLAYLDAPTLAGKMHEVLVPNNEHRIVTAKLITLVIYYLTGEVNFRWLILVALLFLLGIFGLFFRVFRSMQLPLLAFVPVAFVLFQPQYYLTSLSAVTSLQHHVVILFVFSALYLLAGGTRKQFGAALALQVMASLSMSNGLFGWVAGAAVLALQRQWLRLAGWLGLGVGTILFYFHDFPNGQGNESSLPYFLAHPHIVVLAFFTFAGGLFDFFSKASIVGRSVLPTLAGLGLTIMLFSLLWQMNKSLFGRQTDQYVRATDAERRLLRRRYFFTGCYIFLGINALIIAFLRPRFGYEVMLVSNYMQYAALLVVLLYLNVLSEQAARPAANRAVTRWTTVGLVVGGLVWVNWYLVGVPRVAYRKHRILTATFSQKHFKTGLGPSWGTPFLDLADRELTQSTRRGIYTYPDTYFTPLEAKLLASGTIPADNSLKFQITGGGYSYIVNTTEKLPVPTGLLAAVIIQSRQRTYLFPSEPPFGIANFYLDRPVSVVQGEVTNPTVAPGQYRVGILVPSDRQTPIRFSDQTLTVPE